MEEISKLLRSQGEFSSCSSPEPESSPCKAGHQITDTPVVTLEQVVEEEGNRKKRRLFHGQEESRSDPLPLSTGTSGTQKGM